jgi:hypothetical protein
MKIARVGHFIVLSLVILTLGFTTFGQTTTASWGFQGVAISGTGTAPTVTGSTAADAGALTAGSAFTGFHAAAAAAWSNPAGNGSTQSFSSNNWAIGDYYQFQFATTGYTGISIVWDQIGSGTGPRDFKVQYSTDGTNFTDATGTNSTYLVLNAPAFNSTTGVTDHTRTLDLTGVTALNNKAAVYIRLVCTSTINTNGGAVATTGTGRVDNFTARGTASTAAGVGISGRVTTADGRGITNAVVTITGNALAVPRNVITGRRGTYTFDDLEPGETYIVTVRARRFMFSNPSQVISIVDNVTGADFIADGGTARAVEPARKVAVTVRNKW